MKNANINYIFFEQNCGYHLCVFYKKNIDLYFKSKLANNLASKLRELWLYIKNISNTPKTFRNKFVIMA